MSDRAEEAEVVVGSLWKRNPPGREVVRVERVWMYSALGDPPTLTVRAQPTHGGRPIVAPVTWLRERYAEVSDNPTPPASTPEEA